jgi:quercetin dioxygenase-like cupin family protein
VTVSSSSPARHWHGAAPDRFMTHIAMLDVDDQGNSAT